MRSRLVVLIWLSWACLVPPAWSIGVSPISAELDMARERTHLVTVFNQDNERRVAVKVHAQTWALDVNGVDQRGDTDEIVVFPGQFVLDPGERRSVRVAPRFEQSPAVEKSYRILVRELPVDLGAREAQGQTGVRVVTAYATAFYVRPLNPRSQLRLAGVERSSEGLVFRLVNDGNAHTHLRRLALVLRQDGRSTRIYDPEELANLYNANLLAGSERHIAWRWTRNASGGLDPNLPLDVHLELKCESCGGGRVELSFSVP